MIVKCQQSVDFQGKERQGRRKFVLQPSAEATNDFDFLLETGERPGCGEHRRTKHKIPDGYRQKWLLRVSISGWHNRAI